MYENDTAITNMGVSGTWIKTMETAGQFVFRCGANNSVQGIGWLLAVDSELLYVVKIFCIVIAMDYV